MLEDDTCRTEIERRIHNVIRAFRFTQPHESDPLLAGICEVYFKELARLEDQLQGETDTPLSEEKLYSIGYKVAQIISDLRISLIRCLFPRWWECYAGAHERVRL